MSWGFVRPVQDVCVIAVYVVLVFAGGHSSVMTSKMDEEVCQILAF